MYNSSMLAVLPNDYLSGGEALQSLLWTGSRATRVTAAVGDTPNRQN